MRFAIAHPNCAFGTTSHTPRPLSKIGKQEELYELHAIIPDGSPADIEILDKSYQESIRNLQRDKKERTGFQMGIPGQGRFDR